MSELPITKSDYDKSTLMINFLSEFKQRISEMNNVQDVIFSPEIKGYIISFTYNAISYKIAVSVDGIFTTKLKVKYIVENKKVKDFVSQNDDENREIINKIFIWYSSYKLYPDKLQFTVI